MVSESDFPAAQDADELDTQEIRHLQNRGAVVRAKNLKTAALMETGASVPVEDRTGMMLAEAVEPEGRNSDQAADNPVAIEFASVEEAIATHNSPAYQEALKALDGGAVREIRIVPGV